jgi:hypothetical protein
MITPQKKKIERNKYNLFHLLPVARQIINQKDRLNVRDVDAAIWLIKMQHSYGILWWWLTVERVIFDFLHSFTLPSTLAKCSNPFVLLAISPPKRLFAECALILITKCWHSCSSRSAKKKSKQQDVTKRNGKTK